MKIKTADLTGRSLAYAVGVAEGFRVETWHSRSVAIWSPGLPRSVPWNPNSDWSQGGPIIEREEINTFKYNKLNPLDPDKWCGHKVVPRKAMDGFEYTAALGLDGPTPLIAAMRCYVASRLGDEVDVPDELV